MRAFISRLSEPASFVVEGHWPGDQRLLDPSCMASGFIERRTSLCEDLAPSCSPILEGILLHDRVFVS